jgi:ElaB/YqjD/DUF883 family membrane-anchored ribosome-binding protein/Tfp pilus assembly major pilin PilA
MSEFFAAIAQFRTLAAKLIQSIPLWPELTQFCSMLTAPVVRLSQAILRRAPWLKKLEWLFELERFARRNPVALVISMGYMMWRGLHTTRYGHIGTDTAVYPFIAAVSGYNPFLGIMSGAAFGVGDLIQKLVKPDMFGAGGWEDPNYWEALGGYIVAYSSVMWAGWFPGAASRAGRYGVRLALKKMSEARVSATSDGAVPIESQGEGYPPSWMSGAHAMAESAAAVGAGFLSAYESMKHIAGWAEGPGFDWRGTPDSSCKDLENELLNGQAGTVAMGAAGGATIPVIAGTAGGGPGGSGTGGSGTGKPSGSTSTGSPGGSTSTGTTPAFIKPPVTYPDGRANVWDPPLDEQQQRWQNDNLIWDPQQLTYRYPKPGEVPPPTDPPEGPPPFAQSNSRDSVPGACLTLYDQYVTAQGNAISLDNALNDAQAEYQSAIDAMLKMYMKLTMLLGFDAGQAVAPYVEQGAGIVGRELMGTGGQSVSQAATYGLSQAAEQAAQEAEAAEAEAAELAETLGNLQSSVSELESQASGLTSTIEGLKNSVTDVSALESELATAEEEAAALPAQVSEAESEAQIAANRVQRIEEQKKIIDEYDEAMANAANEDKINWQERMSAQSDFDAKVNEEMTQAIQNESAFTQEIEAIKNRQEQIWPSRRGTIRLRELTQEEAQEWEQLASRKKAIENQGFGQSREQMRTQIEEKYKPELIRRQNAAYERYKQAMERRHELGNKIDPNYDPSTLGAAQNELTNRQQNLSQLQERQQQAGEKLENLRTQTSQAQQQASGTMAQIEEQEGQLKLLQQRKDLLNQQAEETNAKLNQARQTAAEKEQEARQLRQSTADSMPDGASTDDRGTLRQIGDKINSGVRTVGRTIGQVLPDFGQESGEEQAKYLQMAQARIDAARANLQALQDQHNQALDDMKRIKPQLDSCVQQHSYWGGDNAAS